jgi:hypothetical protein
MSGEGGGKGGKDLHGGGPARHDAYLGAVQRIAARGVLAAGPLEDETVVVVRNLRACKLSGCGFRDPASLPEKCLCVHTWRLWPLAV